MRPGPPDWRPGASRLAVETRARLLSDIRSWFSQRDVLEVETPVLSRAGNSDPNIRSMSLESPARRYLRTSPEYAMKRLLAAGFGDIFELGRVFRADEKGRFHNPEFTLLEWYRCGWNYLELAAEVTELIRLCGKGQFDDWPVQRWTYHDMFIAQTGLDPFQCTESDLADAAAERGIRAGSLSHPEWLDLILSEVIEPNLPGETITVIHDFLPEQAALARIRPDNPPVAERFEVYLGQLELANGYQELTDANEQQARFEKETKTRQARGEEKAPIDLNLLSAMRHGLPECSGVALGVDRLLMALLKLEHVDAVLAFSADRA
ncbi:MAG: EF-P lysine aminoacylase GenX [Xanthomonadales bacterium]|nr:EF-P lysine aminoacylase GenX [Gammaproteobacteria bacterium]MBT8054522.1 EF-P lysine aminoacylase GenX [Gammaproteobacteria bacterium]NNK52592.1 EF-P lysine aminoacylase GenX [Xanthomonadales bacterium]